MDPSHQDESEAISIADKYKHQASDVSQWRCRLYSDAAAVNPDRSQLPSSICTALWAWFWATCFLSGAKTLLPSDQFHQPWSGWPWWSMMLHQLERKNELLFFNLEPFLDFFFPLSIIRCTTTEPISSHTSSQLSFSCHFRSPAGSLGGAAAINDFFFFFFFWSFRRRQRWIYVVPRVDKCLLVH